MNLNQPSLFEWAATRLLVAVLLVAAGMCSSGAVVAGEVTLPAAVETGGQVTLSLEDYQRLLKLAETQPLPAPSSYAIGQSVLAIEFHQREGHVTATVQAQVEVETFSDDWTLVALLSPGAALESASINGSPVQLVQRAEGLFWLADKRQKTSIQLSYHVDSRYADRAFITSLPIPRAAATRFTLRVPQTRIDLAVAPAANLDVNETPAQTTATGTLPPTSTMMVSWRVAVDRDYILSRAEYTGALQSVSQLPVREASIAWRAIIEAELLVDTQVTVPLVSNGTTLISVRVDGQPATVFSEEGRFAVRLSGAGEHQIELRFLSAVVYPEGAPTSRFDIPQVPVSRFELTLAGNKVVQAHPGIGPQVAPPASVEMTREDGQTVASFFIPMSEHLVLNWMEAIPEDVAVDRRANAVVYQALHAAEGVLYGLAAIHYEITRGEANLLEFSIPASAQVNLISSEKGAIADWVLVEEQGGDSHIRVFLNRAVSGDFILTVAYEQLLGESSGSPAENPAAHIAIPVLRALDVVRQKGMIALLSGPDLALAPMEHEDMSEVGENQLPAFFRNLLQQPVSHTYKYHSTTARLDVETVTPERKQGKFNAQIDTLISIGEVTLKGQVSIENDVKSGVLRELQLYLPADVNVLGVTGPSIRSHLITVEGNLQRVNIEFTREMEGQFRIDLNYERIMLDGVDEVTIPRVDVADADVEHGRIAIEALSALEVQARVAEQLSSLEINELPRQLVLKTTNPILLAYKYVKTEKPFTLKLSITRHEEIDVQVAAIDTATYQTLFTTDGLAVTRVQFDVRNSRRQFLRLNLPAGSEIWSVFVNGSAQKPAYATGQDESGRDVLIKMINSSTAFPVELVYATRGAAMSNFGQIMASLPHPDMIVTHSSWDVYVPASPRYGKPESNMEVLAVGVMTSMQDATGEMLRAQGVDIISGEPLHIELPTQGLLYRFSKLYANQSEEDAWFSLRYVDRGAGFAGFWLSLAGAFLVWIGIVLIGIKKAVSERYSSRNFALGLVATGATILVLSTTMLGASVTPPSILSLAIASGLVARRAFTAWKIHRKA